jgi:uncharacterized protein (TIGR00255 family)
MIYSMTGFGRAEGTAAGRPAVVELKSVNNRFRDVVVRMPRNYSALEERIKKAVAEKVSRGRVDVFIQFDESAAKAGRLRLDLEAGRMYRDLLLSLKEELGLEGKVTVDLLAQFREIIVYEEEAVDPENTWAGLYEVLAEALDKLLEMRQTEGKSIADDFRVRLASMSAGAAEIESRREIVLAEHRSRLEARLAALTEGIELDQTRLSQEIAYLADKSDITEEVVRLRSHFDQFALLLDGDGPAGRRLEFLLQEINREVNTIGSKSGDVIITNRVVDLKTELEKLREQVQNVE